MRLSESEFARLPEHLQVLFHKLPNPGSDEVLACFPDAPGQISGSAARFFKSCPMGDEDWQAQENLDQLVRSAGSRCASCGTPIAAEAAARAEAANDPVTGMRFLYCPKASRAERGPGNTHPTVKPVALMRWLVRLVTPPGGTVLDPFAGSGTTGLAAQAEGFDALLIEGEPKYETIAAIRLGLAEDVFA